MPGLMLAVIALILTQVVHGWLLVPVWIMFGIGVFRLVASPMSGPSD